jgi:hypothetical protein
LYPYVCRLSVDTRPPSITNRLSIKYSRMLMISVSENFLDESECFCCFLFVTKLGSSPPFFSICIYIGHSFSRNTIELIILICFFLALSGGIVV